MKQAERNYFFGLPGEKLYVQEWGDLDKPVILLVHGFPGCAEQGRLLTSTPLLSSFRLIAMDRPGYGQSESQNKITPLKFAKQAKDLLNYLNIQTVSILSVSGGAPYAMALAFILKKRVLKMTSVAGVAPLTRKNFKFMNKQQKKAWVLQNLIPQKVLKLGLNRIWKSGLDKIDQHLFTEMESFSEADKIVFQHPEVGPMLLKTLKISLSGGPDGILQDMKTYSKSWGFSFAGITCPVTLWHGTKDDVVHFKFAEDMKKNIPHATFNVMAGEGHYSLPMNCRDAIISDLLQAEF
ncbi:MAG: alpha/beta hydrolase [Pseudobdellovibrio sp.]